MKVRVMPMRLQKYVRKENSSVQKKALNSRISRTHNASDTFFINQSSLQNQSSSIDIVYFANLFVNPKNGGRLIREQLTDLVATGLVAQAKTHIVLSVPLGFDFVKLMDDISKLFPNPRNVVFNISHDNCHEYPGIQTVHSIANANNSSSHFILYFHSKSMTRFRGRREGVEVALHNTVIARWREALGIFASHPQINKIGSTASESGFIWFNYWWVRASHAAIIESPIKTERRHYYEDWLGRVLSHPAQKSNKDPHRTETIMDNHSYTLERMDCWGLSHTENNIGRGCHPPEAYSALLHGG